MYLYLAYLSLQGVWDLTSVPGFSGWGFWIGKVAARWRHGSGNTSNWNVWVRRRTSFWLLPILAKNKGKSNC